ncbi:MULTISPECIES: hypothetical protein [Rhodobacterales]|uniref:hypothetical protein n=1 Tax=Rhodobacterales TaxID=204455 RepID=UPI000F4B75D6|nr:MULTISPECIES: hypothetical protein [Rhodobacterales]
MNQKNGVNIVPRKKRLEAQAIKRILDAKTREVVGWLYEWNTGEQLPRWKDGFREHVIYE